MTPGTGWPSRNCWLSTKLFTYQVQGMPIWVPSWVPGWFEKSTKCTYTKATEIQTIRILASVSFFSSFLMCLKLYNFSFHNGGRTSGRQSHGDNGFQVGFRVDTTGNTTGHTTGGDTTAPGLQPVEVHFTRGNTE